MSWLCSFERRRKRLLRLAPAGPLKENLAVPWPARESDVRDVPMVALDLETTGLDPRHDQILSAGWVQVRSGRVVVGSARQRTVRPEGDLPASSVVIHGISDDQAATGNPLEIVLRELLQVLSGTVLVAHHAPMDAAFLSAACQRCYGAAWAAPAIDTLHLFGRTLRRRSRAVAEGGLRLAAARQHYGLPPYPEHNAVWDAISAAELWLAMAAEARGGGPGLRLGSMLQAQP